MRCWVKGVATVVAVVTSVGSAEARDPRFAIVLHSGKSENCYVAGGEGLQIKKGRWMGGDNFKMRGPRAAMMNTTIVCTYPDGRTKTTTDHRRLFGAQQFPQSLSVNLPKDRADLTANSTAHVIRGRRAYDWRGELRFDWIK